MIPTQPSDTIADYLAFLIALFGRDPYPSRRGATRGEVEILSAFCPHPLPRLYVKYLLEFGNNSGGHELAFDTVSDIESMIQFHEQGPPTGYQDRPKDGFVFAIEAATGGRVFDFSETSQPVGEPTIGAYCSGKIMYHVATSFRNYLYTESYLESRMPISDTSKWWLAARSSSNRALFSLETRRMQDITDIATKLGFVSYWFSDEYTSCLQREADSLVIYNDQPEGTTVRLVTQNIARVADVERQLLRSFSFQIEQ